MDQIFEEKDDLREYFIEKSKSKTPEKIKEKTPEKIKEKTPEKPKPKENEQLYNIKKRLPEFQKKYGKKLEIDSNALSKFIHNTKTVENQFLDHEIISYLLNNTPSITVLYFHKKSKTKIIKNLKYITRLNVDTNTTEVIDNLESLDSLSSESENLKILKNISTINKSYIFHSKLLKRISNFNNLKKLSIIDSDIYRKYQIYLILYH